MELPGYAHRFYTATRRVGVFSPLTALPRFGAPKQRRKLGMKRGERRCHTLKFDLVHVLPSTLAEKSVWRLLYTNYLSL